MDDGDAPADRGIARRAQRLRLRGHDGGAILPHRSIWRMELPRRRLAAGVALAVLLTLGLLALRGALAQAWSALLVGWLNALDLPGRFDAAAPGAVGWLGLSLPAIALPVAAQHRYAPLAHGACAAALWWAAGRLPDAARPGAYLLRLAVLVHAASLAYFACFGDAAFPHTPASHVADGLRQAWALMLVVPWLHLAAYYLFPFAFWQRAALSVVTLLWLAWLAPLQYAAHAALLHRLGPVVMPLLHLLFGVMVPILGVVALYGWAMSWPDAGDARAPRRGAGA